MERNERNFEREANKQQGNAGKQQTIVGRHSDLASKHRGHRLQVCGARCTEQQCDSVQEEGRGKTTKNEVLETSLATLCAAATRRSEQIERKTQRLKTKEQHQEVISRNHHYPTDCSGKYEAIYLWTIFAFTSEIVVDDKRDKSNRNTNSERGEKCKVIKRKRATNQRGRLVVAHLIPQHASEYCGRKCRDHRSRGIPAPFPLWRKRTNKDQEQRATEQRKERADLEPLNCRAVKCGCCRNQFVHHLLASTCSISALTLGSMRSSIGFGYTPANTMAATNTESNKPSRNVISGNDLLSSLGSP